MYCLFVYISGHFLSQQRQSHASELMTTNPVFTSIISVNLGSHYNKNKKSVPVRAIETFIRKKVGHTRSFG